MSKIARDVARKRQKAERLRSLAAKVRLQQAAPYAGAVAGFMLTVGFGQIVITGIAAGLGAALPRLIRRQIEDIDLRIRHQIMSRAQVLDDETSEAGAGVERWFGEFTLHYLGGHPGLRLVKDAAFGHLSCTDRGVVFRNQATRIRMVPSRIQRVVLENPRQVNARKLPGGIPVPIMTHRHPLLARVASALVRRQRVVLIDYLDDLGERNWIVFRDTWMMPGAAALIKQAVEAAIRTVPREKRVQAGIRGTGNLAQAGGNSREDIAAAEKASRDLLDHGAHVDGAAGRLAARQVDTRFDVVLEGMGSSPEELERVVAELSRIFGKPPERFRELEQRLPMVIRRNQGDSDARQLRDLLVRAGAAVRIDPGSPTTP